MKFNYKQFKYKAFQFLSIVEILHPNTSPRFYCSCASRCFLV